LLRPKISKSNGLFERCRYYQRNGPHEARKFVRTVPRIRSKTHLLNCQHSTLRSSSQNDSRRLTQCKVARVHIDLNDIDAKIKYIRGHSGTEFHPIATASLGFVVVDKRLNIKGVNGLKVGDARIFPLHVSGNTSSP
jgi:choline dehydrogenase-like flavoprotein